MKIGVVGGVERQQRHLESQARDAGHEVECHPGHVSGPRASGLRSLIARCDVLVIITDVNSHGAVTFARALARRHGRRTVMTRRLGRDGLDAILAHAA